MVVAVAQGQSRFLQCRSEAPLVLRPLRQSARALLMTGQLGGGYVAGDRHTLNLKVERGASLSVTGQASAKAYGGDRPISVRVHAQVGAHATLEWLGEPVVPYAGSSYDAALQLELAPSASLFLWECFTAGRLARGERWAFDRFSTSLTLHRAGSLVLREATRLGPEAAAGCGPMNAFATVVAGGPMLEDRLEALSAFANTLPLASVSLRHDLLFVRIGLEDPMTLLELREDIHRLIKPKNH